MTRSLLFVFAFFGLALSAAAQNLRTDSVITKYQYEDAVFYALENGAQHASPRNTWDIAFQIPGFASSILINDGSGAAAYKAPFAIDQWEEFDTTGWILPENALHNSTENWFKGAFNQTTVVGVETDLGWGEYDFNTHHITGDSLYAIKTVAGEWKKLAIELLADRTYHYKVANLDGSGEVQATVAKADYAGKYWGWVSLSDGQPLQRAPEFEWDLLFTKYTHFFPQMELGNPFRHYPVAGVLTHPNAQVAEVVDADPASLTDTSGLPLTFDRNAIGYDWRSTNHQTGEVSLSDTTAFFVRKENGEVYRVIFTGFSSEDGKYVFDVTDLTTPTSVSEKQNAARMAWAFPNPANDFLEIATDAAVSGKITARLVDVSGRHVKTFDLGQSAGFSARRFDITDVPAGVYTLNVQDEAGNASFQKIIVQ